MVIINNLNSEEKEKNIISKRLETVIEVCINDDLILKRVIGFYIMMRCGEILKQEFDTYHLDDNVFKLKCKDLLKSNEISYFIVRNTGL